MIYGFVRLGQYNSARKVEATVTSVNYRPEKSEIDVEFTFIDGDEEITVKKRFLNFKAKYDDKGRMQYYKGMQTVLHLKSNNSVVTYGVDEIMITVGGGIFLLFGGGFLYFLVLRKNSLFDVAYAYEQAMVDPATLTDETQINEAYADQLTKLPLHSVKRMSGELSVQKRRFVDRFNSFSLLENIIGITLLACAVVGCCFWLKSVIIGFIAGLFLFAFTLLPIKIIYNLYFAVLARAGKFSEKRLAVVERCSFESSGSYQQGEFSRTHTVFKKFRVLAIIDGKRSVGYVKGNVPPPRGAILKVLIRPNKPKRWIIDNT